MAANSPPRPPSRREGGAPPPRSKAEAPATKGFDRTERLQKIIARAGISSRRSAEELISAGRVRVNGRIVTELGAKADPREDKIELDGKRLMAPDSVYYVLHKPKNVVSTLSDPEGRPTVGEILRRVGTRVYPVGRLDFATSGVLLATNDGAFANGLLHPRREVPKTYVVKVQGLMSEEDLNRWREGVELDDGLTLPAKARLIRHEEDKTWFEITITEGRNHQIRRMGDATRFRVMRLARTSFAGISHDGLKPGQFRSLTYDELIKLREAYGVPTKVRKFQPAAPTNAAPRRERRDLPGEKRRPPGEKRGPAADERRGPSADRRGPSADNRRSPSADNRRGPPADNRRGPRPDHPPRGARGAGGVNSQGRRRPER
jgi:23S rRNA pseudouridine2605 synthase